MRRRSRGIAHWGPGPVPDRWLHCPQKSQPFIADKFLAFKTPLSGRFKSQLPFERVFTPQMVFDYTNSAKAKLGLWIDLTNTDRFYQWEVVDRKYCQYVKLRCRGHGETPTVEQTAIFIEIVQNFTNKRPFDIIGVHCTHGFNRTGFLIVSYLVEKLDFSVEKALATFARARPPGIYKEDYIRELFKRYGNEEDSPAPPPLPDWCLGTDCSVSDKLKSGHKRPRENTHVARKEKVVDEEIATSSNSHNAEDTSEFSKPKQKRKRVKKKGEMVNSTTCAKVVAEESDISGSLQNRGEGTSEISRPKEKPKNKKKKDDVTKSTGKIFDEECAISDSLQNEAEMRESARPKKKRKRYREEYHKVVNSISS